MKNTTIKLSDLHSKSKILELLDIAYLIYMCYLAFLQNIFIDICLAYHDYLVEFDGEVEHLHLLINYQK